MADAQQTALPNVTARAATATARDPALLDALLSVQYESSVPAAPAALLSMSGRHHRRRRRGGGVGRDVGRGRERGPLPGSGRGWYRFPFCHVALPCPVAANAHGVASCGLVCLPPRRRTFPPAAAKVLWFPRSGVRDSKKPVTTATRARPLRAATAAARPAKATAAAGVRDGRVTGRGQRPARETRAVTTAAVSTRATPLPGWTPRWKTAPAPR